MERVSERPRGQSRRCWGSNKVQEGAGSPCPLHDRQMQADEPLFPLTATWLHPPPATGTLPLRSDGELRPHVLSPSTFPAGWGTPALRQHELESVRVGLGAELWGEVAGAKGCSVQVNTWGSPTASPVLPFSFAPPFRWPFFPLFNPFRCDAWVRKGFSGSHFSAVKRGHLPEMGWF